jgi:protein-S-isoprenylcysteine O-methyltransferase Ste14
MLLIFGWILFVLFIDYKVGIEEKILVQKYGEAYLQYKESTPKYLII